MTRPNSESASAEAAAWYARLNADMVTAAERSAFAEWHAADATNQQAWSAVAASCAALDAGAEDEALRLLRTEALGAPARNTDWWQPLAAAAALVALIGGTTFLIFRDTPAGRSAEVAAREYRTGIGQRATIRLPDGSDMTLNAASIVRVATWGATRGVEVVRGDAFFHVAKDQRHPFIVKGADNAVTALGTAFSVEVSPGRFGVALVEGTVRVDLHGPGRSAVLKPGGTLREGPDGTHVTRTGADTAVGWLHGRLNFDSAPLSEVVDEINRYSTRKVVLGNAALGERHFSGALSTMNGGEALAGALEAYGIARAARSDSGEIVLVPY